MILGPIGLLSGKPPPLRWWEHVTTEDEEATKMIDQTIAFVKNYGKFQQQGFTIQFTNVAQ